jgi:prephenate dehydrogenase
MSLRRRCKVVEDTIAVVGVGLIGGSVGLAARGRGVARRVLGVEPDPERRRTALERGAVTAAYAEVGPEILAASLCIVCTPVTQTARAVAAVARSGHTKVITDVGSTKVKIVETVESHYRGRAPFVGGHPLAGSERSGPANADGGLFAGKMVVLTPTPRTDRSAFDRVTNFWHLLGARVTTMTPEEHDRALAVTSHLPNLTAYALASLLPPSWFNLAASGFRDSTRLAASDPELWTGIFNHNRCALLDALDRLQTQLDCVRCALRAGDDRLLTTLLTEGWKVRHALGSEHPPAAS